MLIYKLKYKGGVQGIYILRRLDRGLDVSMEEHVERYKVHVDGDGEWRKHMEEEWWQRKTCGTT